jgi:hypothetical protein
LRGLRWQMSNSPRRTPLAPVRRQVRHDWPLESAAGRRTVPLPVAANALREWRACPCCELTPVLTIL